jgi:hypothetical protein
MTVVPRPPYSLDLASCDFFFFSKVKIKLRGVEIWHGRGDPGWIVEGVEDPDTKGLRGQLPVVAEMLGLLCAIVEALLRSGRCRLRLWVRLLSSFVVHFGNLRITDRRMSEIIIFSTIHRRVRCWVYYLIFFYICCNLFDGESLQGLLTIGVTLLRGGKGGKYPLS